MTPNPDPIIPPLIEFVSAELLHGEEDLDELTPLLALGVIDSLSMVSLLDFIQRTFDVVVPNDSVTVENFEDIGAIAELVRERLGTHDIEVSVERSPMERAIHVLEAAGVVSEHHELGDGSLVHALTVDGPGAPWILLPGLGNPASSWGNVLKGVAGDHAAAAIDLVGFGLSTGPARPRVRDHVAHLEQLLDARYPDAKLVLVGSSVGCVVALEYARRHPARVEAVVVVGFGVIDDPQAWTRELDELWKRPEEFLARTYHEAPRLTEQLREQFESIHAMDAYHSYLSPEDLDAAVFDEVEAPVLVLGGSSDRVVGMHAMRAAVERMPSATLVELARCGHFPGTERPDETIYSIDSFLRTKG